MNKVMSKGQQALETLSLCRAARIAVPDDALREIDNCYRHFMEGKPVAGWVAVEHNRPAPQTLGEAFGVPDHRGKDQAMLKRKRIAMAAPRLVAWFTGGQGTAKLARTREGYAEAALRLGLTESEVEDWCLQHPARKRNPVP